MSIMRRLTGKRGKEIGKRFKKALKKVSKTRGRLKARARSRSFADRKPGAGKKEY